VPPFPAGADPEEYDRLRRRVLWKMRRPLRDRRPLRRRHNAHDAQLASQMGFDPKLLARGCAEGRLLPRAVADAGVFALNLVHRTTGRSSAGSTKPVDVDPAPYLNGFPFTTHRHRCPVARPGRGLARLEVAVPSTSSATRSSWRDRRLRLQAGRRPVLRKEDTRMTTRLTAGPRPLDRGNPPGRGRGHEVGEQVRRWVLTGPGAARSAAPSTVEIAWTSRVVEVRKASSAPARAETGRAASSAAMPARSHSSRSRARVTPGRQPEERGACGPRHPTPRTRSIRSPRTARRGCWRTRPRPRRARGRGPGRPRSRRRRSS